MTEPSERHSAPRRTRLMDCPDCIPSTAAGCTTCAGDAEVPGFLTDPKVMGEEAAAIWGWKP